MEYFIFEIFISSLFIKFENQKEYLSLYKSDQIIAKLWTKINIKLFSYRIITLYLLLIEFLSNKDFRNRCKMLNVVKVQKIAQHFLQWKRKLIKASVFIFTKIFELDLP